jgi:formate hydrogenlyase subunit 3/multisubunit Na+/H+ antiporter MnhD subunit
MNAHLHSILILLSLAWPLLLVMLMGFPFFRSVILRLAPSATVPALLLGLWMMPESHSIVIPSLLLGGELGVDGTGGLFLVFSSLVWLLVGIYAHSYFAARETLTRFSFFYLLTLTGNLAVILAQDVLVLSTGLALMSFSAYGLIAGKGERSTLRAGRIYIILVVLGELLLFEAVLMAAQVANSTSLVDIRHALMASNSRDLIMLLALLGFGIRLGVVGLHIWLPVSLSAAPLPAAALIATTMLKAGLLGALKLLPLGYLAIPAWGESLIIIGLLSMVYGAGVGLTQQRAKTVLAYSSMVQTGLIVSILGLGLLMPTLWPVLLIAITGYTLHLALTTSALFLGLGSDKPKLSRGIWLAMWLPALALAGAPVSGGMLTMALVKTQAASAPAPWNTLIPAGLIITSLLSSLLMVRLLYLIRPATGPSRDNRKPGLLWPWVVNLVLMIILPWWVLADTQSVSLVLVWQSLWPVIAAIILTLVGLRFKNHVKLPDIPEGDILIGWESIGRFLLHWVKNLSDHIQVLQQKCKNVGTQLLVLLTDKLR